MDDLFLDESIQLGKDDGQGNLLGVQPYLKTEDYLSVQRFTQKTGGYLEAAQEKGWLNPRTVVVFPEYMAAWLIACGENPTIHRAATTKAAMSRLVLRHPLGFFRALLGSPEPERMTAAIFRMRAEAAARFYQQAFGGLTRKYQLTIVAGSIILSSPYVKNGEIHAGKGTLYNTIAVFKPDGGVYPDLVRKIYLVNSEQPFVTPGRIADLLGYDTPAGKLGVLICADSWYPEPYRRLQAEQVRMLAVPSFLTSHDGWRQPWRGYDGTPPPADVDLADIHRLSEGQAWRKYAMTGRIGASGAHAGVNVFLRGELWDLPADSGQSMMVKDGEARETTSPRAALLNVWL